MEEFLKSEIERINYLYGNDFKGDITPDDVKLIARFEYQKAKNEIEYKIENDKILEKAENNVKGAQSVFEKAISNMEELHARALGRMDRLEKRERPTIEDAQKNELKIDNAPAVLHHGI